MKRVNLIILILISFGMICCKNKKDRNTSEAWWKETVFYEIYMPSFKDSNGDGYSDFPGLTSKLDYIENLGIKGIWLTPFLRSPKVDNGYDVSDYYNIDSTYGSLEDFKIFLDEAHKRQIRIIMDMAVNHTSTQSKWFQEAKKSKYNPYRDYYIWQDHPNNWESFFGGSAWEFDSITNQYYYHKFDAQMADLNWQNPKVVEAVQDVLRYWLHLGVDGFRLDVINFLTTNGITHDNPLDEYGDQDHLNDINQKDVRKAMKTIRKTVNEFDDRFLVGEIGSDKIEVLNQYQGSILDVVFNFNFGSIKEFSAQRLFNELKSMENTMSHYPTLFFGSHDMPRLASRLAENNPDRAEALAALMLTAKGVPFIYYGEEIGMENINALIIDEIHDIQGRTQYFLALKNGQSKEEALIVGNYHNRDKSRSPMQWNANKYAGFSSHIPWINVNPNYTKLNVEELNKDQNSLLNNYRKLIDLRNSETTLQYGTYTNLNFSDDLLSFSRLYRGVAITCYFNFSNSTRDMVIKDNDKILMGSLQLKPNHYLIVKTL